MMESPFSLLFRQAHTSLTWGRPRRPSHGIKPFGLIYALVITNQVPVLWAINPAKAYGGTDFTHNAKNYIGGPFIIPADFVTPAAVTTINTWKAKGVVVDGPTLSPILNVPVYDRITSFPKTVINTTNAGIAEDFYQAAEIPAVPNQAYREALPAGLTACDDIFTMPHADPTWLLHSSLIPFVNSGGFFGPVVTPSVCLSHSMILVMSARSLTSIF